MKRFYTLRARGCDISCSLSEFSKQLTKHLLSGKHLSCVTTKPVFERLTRPNTKWAVQLQKMTRGLKFQI